jgi:hypothetical protein
MGVKGVEDIDGGFKVESKLDSGFKAGTAGGLTECFAVAA